jgi:hypothetical protein
MPPDALEYVVRPYTTPDVHGSIIIPSTPRGSRERATLTWGSGSPASVPTPVEVTESVSFELVCCKENLSEQSRETEDVQIFDSSGGSTYITVERPKSIRLKKKDKNNCNSPLWSHTSDVEQSMNEVNAEWDAALHSGTINVGGGKNCSVAWQFKY